ncbi:DUF2242 domain-containing protein [Propionivibrio sp.]|uniref:DUF2242 domain-containing protein n=1 Tax=Propionivibrio sp. TaxID=2212460 RepID=UPI003BEFC515
MKIFSRPLFQCAVFLFGLLLNGCSATPQARVHLSETFATETPFQYYSSRAPEGACEIGKRALLSQGYQIEGAQPLNIRGDKYFQPTPEQATKLTISLVCLPSSLGAVIYANALETHFELKSRGSSAGVSVSGFGSLSLPWAADKDTLVKVGEVTITAPEFYQRLFELIKTLDG